MKKRNFFFSLVGFFVIVLASFFVYLAYKEPMQASGWIQVALVVIGIPVIFFQLQEIRQKIYLEPQINIGVANVHELPLSNLKTSKVLKPVVDVAQGYPFFKLVVRNSGKATSKYVKIFVEYKGNSLDSKGLYNPKLIINEFSNNKKGFVSENNVDFIFIGGSDYCIYPDDTDIFGFSFTTVVGRKFNGEETNVKPYACDCFLQCTVWAEGLVEPVIQDLTIRIIERKYPEDPLTKTLFPPHTRDILKNPNQN
jgi:hypothetical protein